MIRKNILTLAGALMLSLSARAIEIIHGPFLQNVYSTEATIVWVTDAESDGWVELAPSDGSNFYATSRPKFYDTSTGVKNIGKVHSVKLTGLKPGTKYRYRIYSQEVLKRKGWHVVWGYVAATRAYGVGLPTFTTLDPSKSETSFAVLNDIHNRDYLIEPLLKKADWKNRDMVIYNGDMMSLFPVVDTLFTAFLDESVRVFAKEKPFYYVRGNHETRGEAAARFHDYICPREPSLYFMWRQGPVCFIALDTGEDKPDDDLEYAGANDYDGYRTEQAEWLKQAIKSEEYTSAKYHVVVCHIPPALNKDAWHGDIDVKNKFVSVLNDAGVDVMICAHWHRTVFYPNAEGINFPIIINSNNSCLFGTADADKIHMEIVDVKGKTQFKKDFPSKR